MKLLLFPVRHKSSINLPVSTRFPLTAFSLRESRYDGNKTTQKVFDAAVYNLVTLHYEC